MATATGAAGSAPPAPGTQPQGAKGQLFEAQAASYSKFRPTYPPELFRAVLEFGGPGLGRATALDVATGSGQVAAALADSFSRVLACDSSRGQLAHAAQRPNIEYVLAPAEALPAPPGSVDLLTCAQALHWFDVPAFYREARRVLRPGGALAVWGYGLARFVGPPGRPCAPGALAEANRLLDELYGVTLGALWDDKRALVEAQYAGLEPGPAHFAEVARQQLALRKPASISGVIGYLASWSAHSEHRRRHPDLPDPLLAFKPRLMAALGVEDEGDEGAVMTEAPLFLILSRQPVPPD